MLKNRNYNSRGISVSRISTPHQPVSQGTVKIPPVQHHCPESGFALYYTDFLINRYLSEPEITSKKAFIRSALHHHPQSADAGKDYWPYCKIVWRHGGNYNALIPGRQNWSAGTEVIGR